MQDSHLLKSLNTAQKQAVLHAKGPLLIIAGAGAGKTRTIAHRIAYLMEGGVPARSILAVTFTNKAASEMRERVKTLVPDTSALPMISTFHALGVRLLREFHEEAGISRNFTILDRDDSIKAVKRALETLDMADLTPRSVLGAISRAKSDGLTWAEYTERANNFREQCVARVWDLYERALREEEGLDFDDLILCTLALLKTSPKTLSLLRARWSHIHIDEYQDTNRVQFEIARMLAGDANNICVVGDLDQCLVAGTQITMADGTHRPIESIREGDVVLSNYGGGRSWPARVSKSIARNISGELIKITTGTNRTLVSTPEHIHFAGYKLGHTPQLYFTYLMHKRGKGFRLGVSAVYTKGQRKSMVGFQQRCNHEHADKVWILKAHTSPNEARILEYKLSLQYSIPTLPFVARKESGKNGYVHDQKILDEIFASFDTERSGYELLKACDLSPSYPHHRAQATTGGRRNITLTLCAEKRGETPMHRISLAASDGADRKDLARIGISVRRARKSSDVAWRYETVCKEYGDVFRKAEKIRAALPYAEIVQIARLGGGKTNPKDGNSLPFLPASSVLPGMAMFDEQGGYDIVKKVERIPTRQKRVYDLNIENTHNFIANNIVTHNCIYTWRNARLENLLEFEREFSDTTIVTLEQNYRSTRTILTAANAVIERNVRRKPKKLFTEKETGEAITFYGARNEIDESWFVANTIQDLVAQGTRPSEIAVLYRENFQSRTLEEAFLHFGIPYRVIGTRFFERKEVKDLLAYLRASLNPKARGDLVRIAASPPRGIGKTTLEKMLAGNALYGVAAQRVAAFRETLADIRRSAEILPTSETVRFAFERSGLEANLKKDTEEGAERLANIRELVNLATRYDDALPPEGVTRLLEEAALQSDQDELEKPMDAASLMTVHASKGLEFDAVFVTGLEQGLFPAIRADDTDRDPEEERRLFYVALTRARHRLFLSYAAERMRWGSRERTLPSEFLDDIDSRLVESAEKKQIEPEHIIE